jgi:hypothetical protein
MIPKSFVVRLAWSIVAGIVERTANAEHGRSAAGEKSMRMLSGRLHWLTMGLALLVSAQGFTTRRAHGQMQPGQAASRQAAMMQASHMSHAPGGMMPGGMMPGGMMPGGTMPGGMMGPEGPMSMSFPGPAPMDMGSLYGDSPFHSPDGCPMCGNGMCGGHGCGPLAGRLRRPCACGGSGCIACGVDNGCMLGGGLFRRLLGPLAPYSDGGTGSQRWFDFYAGTIGLSRVTNVGGYSGELDPITGVAAINDVISTQGIGGTPVLRTTDLDMDRMRYGLELIAGIQVGPGSNIEVRYFGLNNWNLSQSVRLNSPDLYSVFSDFGQNPFGGFDDTDGSFVHTIRYRSELHNGEVNYRRRFAAPVRAVQGSWLAGIRHFDLDEQFGFESVGPLNNTFTFNNRRFANIDTFTRNKLTGFQIGGDLWVNVVPGIMLGVEGKSGIYGNRAEVQTEVFTNSIPAGSESLRDTRTAYLSEFTASAVYRLTYSWSVRASYNLLYVDNVALAPENFNTRDYSNAIGGGAFTMDRYPFLNLDGESLYQGWSIGGEFLY